MNKTYLLAIVAALVAAPMAFAHNDGTPYGLPKTYCENEEKLLDQYNHDYLGGPGFVIIGAVDGSIPPCPYSDEWDGHYEWAIGGAWLLACETACDTYDPKKRLGDGTLICWGTYADHSLKPQVWVFDHVLTTAGLPVSFTVGADHWTNVPNPDPAAPWCGDFESDYTADCVNHCQIQFAPGKDGSYQVFVNGFAGHVWSN